MPGNRLDGSVGPGCLVAGRYRLVRQLAGGSQGQVWQARDTRLDVDVAIKEFKLPADASDAVRAELLSRAEREARNAARLREHPNIVAVYDVAVEEDRPWTVMRLVDGHSLADELETRARLPADEVTRIAVGLLRALLAAHSAGIVHRDVKPGNVMIEDSGEALLTDFGIALHTSDIRLTQTGFFVGSPAYMAPERLLGSDNSPASDLFSLGVTLYQAVEGVLPFSGDTPEDVRTAILSAKPRPMEHAGSLAPLIASLLAENPAHRPSIPHALAMVNAAGARETLLTATASTMRALIERSTGTVTAAADTLPRIPERLARTKLESLPGVTVAKPQRVSEPVAPMPPPAPRIEPKTRERPGSGREGRRRPPPAARPPTPTPTRRKPQSSGSKSGAGAGFAVLFVVAIVLVLVHQYDSKKDSPNQPGDNSSVSSVNSPNTGTGSYSSGDSSGSSGGSGESDTTPTPTTAPSELCSQFDTAWGTFTGTWNANTDASDNTTQVNAIVTLGSSIGSIVNQDTSDGGDPTNFASDLTTLNVDLTTLESDLVGNESTQAGISTVNSDERTVASDCGS